MSMETLLTCEDKKISEYVRVIENLDELKNMQEDSRKIYLYSAGFTANNFYINLQASGIKLKFEAVLVTRFEGNPYYFYGIPVKQYDTLSISENDCILLSMAERSRNEIIEYLKDCRAELAYISPKVFYQDVYNSIKPFADYFPEKITGLNLPAKGEDKFVWSCWWQGEDEAPELVKACWKSQRENLPDDVRHIIITKDNYQEFITIPDYILDKFKDGNNLLAHLADYIRVCLLYKYGGVWLDSTVLQLEKLPDDCWRLPLYTWQFDNTHFYTKTIWTTWFLAGKKGSVLYQFVMEAFLYYFSVYDKVKYYFTIDYFIAICTRQCEGVLEQFKQIPYNNEFVLNLNEHLRESYTPEHFRACCKGAILQKINRHIQGYPEDSMYSFIIHKYLQK